MSESGAVVVPLAASTAGRLVVARDWSVLEVDSHAEAVLGDVAPALTHRSLWDVLPELEQLDLGRALQGAMRDHTPAAGEDFYPHLGLWLEWRVGGHPDGLAMSLLDVTGRRVDDPRAVSALSRLALLARVSEALAATDDPDEAVGRLARLVVPYLADWSFVTVIEDDGQLRDLGLAHRDPHRYDDLAAYSVRHLEEMTETAAVWKALHGTTHVVVPRFSEQILANFIPDPTAAALTRRLDPYGVASFPLVARGRTFGALTLVTTGRRGPHTPEELSTGLEVARRAAPVLEAARAAQRSRTLAESMQRSLLTVPSRAPGLTTAFRYLPASHDRAVGGDWYDTFDLPGGSTVVTIGDVMGHDVAAIAAMTQLRTLVRGMAWATRHAPSEVLAAVDRASSGLGTSTFATAFTAELARADDDGSVRMTWSNAGHPPPFVRRASGVVERVGGDARPDIPLGVAPERTRRDAVTVLEPGDVVFLYTDGLVERRDRDIETGLEHLATALRRGPRGELGALLDRVLVELTSDGVGDDIALLAVEVPTRDRPDPAPERGPASLQVVNLRVPADTIAPAIGRDHVRRHGSHLTAERVADAQLLVTELLGNAVRHGRAPITLDIQVTPRTLRVSVTDSGAGRPVVRITRPEDVATGGRGLLITDALASRWGVGPADNGPGKSVWFEIDATNP